MDLRGLLARACPKVAATNRPAMNSRRFTRIPHRRGRAVGRRDSDAGSEYRMISHQGALANAAPQWARIGDSSYGSRAAVTLIGTL
jgi:hypothetical protein